MAGDGHGLWVLDIIFHALILVANGLPSFWSSWSIELLLVVSFVMQLALTVLAGLRWRGRGDSWAVSSVVWLCYVSGDYVATTALSNLSVSSTSGERQLLAFWAPFFLLHLGGPDSITAYQIEDNALSGRSVLGSVLQVLGASYVVYKSLSNSRTLAVAAWLMLCVGVTKYMEKILALHRANLRSIRSEVKRQRRQWRRRADVGRRYTKTMLGGDMVMVAHYLFYICKRTMVDSSVVMEQDEVQKYENTFYELPWKGMFEVIEMELSLMYDFLYTKAAVIHTWHGYSLRALAPLATAAALLLVELGEQDGRREADVVITRMLLIATFLLETVSLLRALGSSWTAFLLYNTTRWRLLHHEVFCTRRWHPFLASVGRLVKAKGHRSWSGHIGQLDLLRLTHHADHQSGRKAKESVWPCLWWKYWKEEHNTETIVLPPDVKSLILARTTRKVVDLREAIRNDTIAKKKKAPDILVNAVASRIRRGQETLRTVFGEKFYGEHCRQSLGNELQEGIITWHIATDIYLLESPVAQDRAGDRKLRKRVAAIRMLSNYMLFLLVERPHMLPGLVLPTLYELTSDRLEQILQPGVVGAREKLKRIRQDALETKKDHKEARESYLSLGVQLADRLVSEETIPKSFTVKDEGGWYAGEWRVLHTVLDVWIEMLFYASYRCSRESHARQLSSGGELATIVWLIAAHIQLFAINKKGMATLARRPGI